MHALIQQCAIYLLYNNEGIGREQWANHNCSRLFLINSKWSRAVGEGLYLRYVKTVYQRIWLLLERIKQLKGYIRKFALDLRIQVTGDSYFFFPLANENVSHHMYLNLSYLPNFSHIYWTFVIFTELSIIFTELPSYLKYISWISSGSRVTPGAKFLMDTACTAMIVLRTVNCIDKMKHDLVDVQNMPRWWMIINYR